MASTAKEHPLKALMDKLDEQLNAVSKDASDRAERIQKYALDYAIAAVKTRPQLLRHA